MTDPSIRCVGLVVHVGRPAAVAAARTLADWLGERDVTTRAVRGDDVGATETRDEGTFADGLDSSRVGGRGRDACARPSWRTAPERRCSV